MKTFLNTVKPLPVISAAFALAMLILCVPLFAATRYVSPSGADSGTCVNVNAPCKTFSYAIAEATAGDTIHAAIGTYNEHDIQVNKNLTVIGSGAGNTLIDASLAGRVVLIYATVTISGITLENGSIAGSGAGIYNAGNLTLISAIVCNNSATGVDGSGAGIYNTSSLTVNSSFVYGNNADVSGGGVYNFSASANATLTNTVVSNNTAQYGGGILNYNGSTVTLNNSRVSRNKVTAEGGGMDNNDATAILNNVTFSANQSSSSGAGMKNDNTASATFTNVTFTANAVTTGEGGGLYNLNGAVAIGTNVTFSDNYADGGGGVKNIGATLTLADSTFSGNTAGAGGAMYNDTNGTATLTNCTISGNIGYYGGAGIEHNVSTTILKNTIVSNGNRGFNCEGGVPITSLGHNLDDGNTCGFSPALSDLINVDPELLTLANNGKKGYTQSLALSKGSPAIDKGTNSGCPAKDQRGIARPLDGDGQGGAVCDIGSYEFKK